MNNLLSDINNYYTKKVKQFGPISKGVDWKDENSQFTRYYQLLKLIEGSTEFELNDLGCGYGGLLSYMLENGYSKFKYIGYDLSEEMISHAIRRIGNTDQYKFKVISEIGEMDPADYTIASGLFNVKLDYDETTWLSYILDNLSVVALKSIKGFSFNILTNYSDKEHMKNYLYYADPLFFFDYCKKNFSRNVALLHDYNLYEFTIIVKKDL